MLYEKLSYQVIGACMAVHGALGPGLLEQCYHNALYHEIVKNEMKVRYNEPYTVVHQGETVGEYLADLVVEDKIILELKSVQYLTDVHSAQLINYLRISGLKLGFLINFQGLKPVWKRFVF